MGYPNPTQSPYYNPPHNFDPVTPEERERIRIFQGRGDARGTYPEVIDPFNLPPRPMPDPKRPTMEIDRLEIEPTRDQFINDIMDSLINRGITEQNQEVMGSKEQVFPRYANPEDGTLNNEEMARVDPTDKLLLDSLRKGEIGDPNSPRIRKAIIDLERKIYNDGRASSMDGALIAADPVDKAAYGPQMTRSQFSDYNELRSPGYKDRRDALRMRLINAGILRGV